MTALLPTSWGGSVDNIKQFWEKMPPRSGMEEKVGWKDKVIPIALHGDGEAVTAIRGKSSKQVDCLSWSSLLARGQTRFTTSPDLVCLCSPLQKGWIWMYLGCILLQALPQLESSVDRTLACFYYGWPTTSSSRQTPGRRVLCNSLLQSWRP